MAEYKEYKVENQMNLGWNQSFAATAAVPMIAKRVWNTLEQATLFAKQDPTAIAGLILTVTSDTESNNGVYFVESIGENASLKKLEAPIKGITLNGAEQTPDENGIVKLTLSAEDVDVNLDGYATEAWVEEQGYLTEHQPLTDYAKTTEVESAISTAVTDMATQTWVEGKGYLTEHQPLTDYAKTTEVESAISTAVTDMATQTWVEEQGYAKTSEVDSKIVTAITSVYRYQGSVENYESLPTENLIKGDVWNVEETGDNYAWTGTEWDKLGGNVNLTGYATQAWVKEQGYLTEHQPLTDYAKTTEVESAISTAVANMATQTWVEEQGYAKTEDLVDSYSKTESDEKFVSKEGFVAEENYVKSVGDNLTVDGDGKLTVDLSAYAKTEDLVDSYSKEESDAKYALAGSGELNIIETINIKTAKDTDATSVEVVEKAVTIDLSGIDERLDVLEAVINPGGSDTNITDLIAGKQDKLDNGSATQPHLIWDSTNTKWTPGKIEIPQELPSYDSNNEGQVLTVGEGGTTVIWSAPAVTTTVTKNEATEETVETYTIAQGETSVNIYSTEQVYTKEETTELVESYFAWHNL